MTTWIALLRAVNVGGTGKLPMADLRALCADAGFADVRTYIASGNVVLRSALDEAGVKRTLESALAARMGKPVGVLVRDAAEMAAIAATVPFPDVAPNRTVVVFLDAPVTGDPLTGVRHLAEERVVALGRELHIAYGEGMAASKLVLPTAKTGTGRNLNTVRKLAELAEG